MDPVLRRTPRRWTAEEDSLLYREAMKQSPNSTWDWNRIAASFKDRSNKDCRKRWINHVSGGLRKGPWAEGEDTKLREAVKELGQRWTLVAEAVGCRSADQCAKRWQHHLDPQLDRREWTKDEDNRLLGAVHQQGRIWKAIRDQYFPGRSRNDVKNRHTILVRRGSSSTSATFAKRHALELASDEEEDQIERTDIRENKRNNEEDEEEDDVDEEEDGDDNNNTDNDDDNDVLGISINYAPGGADQCSMDLDQYLTPFSSFDFSAASTQPEHTFSLPLSMSDVLHLGPAPAEQHYSLDRPSNNLNFLATADLESDASNIPWSFPAELVHTASLPADSTISQSPCQPQPLTIPTYKRVTLVLENYERGLMDQLLQVVSTSQGKSQIEILP